VGGDAVLENYTETKAEYFNTGLAAPKWGSKNVDKKGKLVEAILFWVWVFRISPFSLASNN
jgi:hypothetical protein